jgi:hypothetical protein
VGNGGGACRGLCVMSEYEDIRKDWRAVFVLSIIVLALMVVSGYALTAGRGLSDNTFVLRFTIYSILGGAGILFLFIVNLYNFLNRTRLVKTIVHEPEESLVGSLKTVRNPWLLSLLTMIVFLVPLYFLGKFSNTFFSGIPFEAQQITTFSNIWADSVFPALAENLFIFIPLCLVYTWNWKKNWRSNRGLFYSINLLLIPLLFAFAWQAFHWSVYGSNEVALLSTFFFGLIGVLVSMITVSFIPWAIMHFLTNFMLSLKKYGLMSNDSVTFAIITIEFVLILLWIVVYRLDKSKSGG